MNLTFQPLCGIPLIKKGDDIAKILLRVLPENHISLQDSDVLVITQKIISKSEGRQVQLSSIQPTERALELAKISTKDPRLIELILRESKEILRINQNHIIVEHRLGFICANAGIDHSNVCAEDKSCLETYLLLPVDPERSAKKIRNYFLEKTGKKIGILVIDSHGRAWRNGIIGTAIGLAGIPALVDLRGKEDLFGYKLRITLVAAADELAGAASLVMGQSDEKIPVVHVRGFPYKLRESTIRELFRDKEKDLFR